MLPEQLLAGPHWGYCVRDASVARIEARACSNGRGCASFLHIGIN